MLDENNKLTKEGHKLFFHMKISISLILIFILIVFLFTDCAYSSDAKDCLRVPSIFMNYTINAKKLWSDVAKEYIMGFNQDNLSLDRAPFFIGVRHQELSKDEKEEILKALKSQEAKKVGIELFVGDYQYFKPGNYWLDLMNFLKSEGFDVILLEKDLEIELQAQIIQCLRYLCFVSFEYIGQPHSELVRNMQTYQEKLEENYILYRKILASLPEETFHKYELMGREYFSRILAAQGHEESMDLYYELEEKFVELNIKTSFDMLKVSHDEDIDVMIIGACHIAHLLVLTKDITWHGIVLHTDISESTISIETIVGRKRTMVDILQRNRMEEYL